MSDEGAILIPFGVSARWKGRGLGLASLVQKSCEGAPLALAQLFAKLPNSSEKEEPEIVETLLPPGNFRTLRGKGDGAIRAKWIITGNFQPPEDEPGRISLLAYDAATEKISSSVTHWIEEESAAADLSEAFDRFFFDLGLGKAGLAELYDLSWEPLDLVLRSELNQAPHPLRGGARDPLAALVCLERALTLKMGSPYIASRIANLAGVIGLSEDLRGRPIAERALERAVDDAPDSPALHEARAVLALERSDYAACETHTLEAIARDPKRTRAYALLAETRRRSSDLAGAEAAVNRGFAIATDPFLLHQRAVLFKEAGRTLEARAAWETALAYRPIFEPAFENMAKLAVANEDALLAGQLVDRVLDTQEGSPAILQTVLTLLDTFETKSLGRAAKQKRVAESYVERLPKDPFGHFALGNAEVELGNLAAARAAYKRAEACGPEHPIAIRAALARQALQIPSLPAGLSVPPKGEERRYFWGSLTKLFKKKS